MSDTCPSCHRTEGRHWLTCTANRCARCQRAPRLIGPWCGFCLKEVRKEREQVVAEKLLRPDRDDGHPPFPTRRSHCLKRTRPRLGGNRVLTVEGEPR